MSLNKRHGHRFGWALLASGTGILLAFGLILALGQSRATAQPPSQGGSGGLEITKHASSRWVRQNGYLTYTIRVTNISNSDIYAWMTDTLPTEVDCAGVPDASMGSTGVSNDVITWTASLSPQKTALITFVTQLVSQNEGAWFTNTAEITGAGELVSASVRAQIMTTFYLRLPMVLRNYPPIPTLNPIPLPDASSSYVVSWGWPSGTPAGISRYVLQESPASDFTTVRREWTTNATSLLVTDTYTLNTPAYYYRVRADSDTRWGIGPWSNVQIGYPIYYDDFSNTNSGWPVVNVLVIPESKTRYRLRYETGGYYRISIDAGGPQIWFHQPNALAPYRPPTDKYCVETLVQIRKMQPPYNKSDWDYYPFWGNGGLVFGANEANTNIYALCLTVGARESLGWFIVNNPEYTYPYKGCNYLPGVKYGEDGLNIRQWHRFQASVDGDYVTVYINGINKGTYHMPGLRATTRVGLIGGDYEITPADYWFDWFRVIPNRACTP